MLTKSAYLTSHSAFSAIVNACLFGLSLSYLIPILVLVIRGRHILPRGQFRLGMWGLPLNIFSIVFLSLVYVAKSLKPSWQTSSVC